MGHSRSADARLDLAGTLDGMRRMAPLCLFVIAFGLAFGVAAVQRGLSELEALLMSALVFAGASQFAALELWGPEIPLVALIASTFAINARHLLMGASLYPWLRDLPPAALPFHERNERLQLGHGRRRLSSGRPQRRYVDRRWNRAVAGVVARHPARRAVR
ncbi:AzlC family ABC transporter permease [Modicisalibacter luteus]|uniref:AzlC family ABC transporter permease n=1 Tax=Modicisalibacter luteus TaxID=453962 RepID=UPI003641C6E5